MVGFFSLFLFFLCVWGCFVDFLFGFGSLCVCVWLIFGGFWFFSCFFFGGKGVD